MTKETLLDQIEQAKHTLVTMHPVYPSAVERQVDVIINCVRQLIEITPPDQLIKGGQVALIDMYEDTCSQLVHTRGKEVGFLRNYYEQMIQPRAAKKRQDEFDDYYRKVIERINRETAILSRL